MKIASFNVNSINARLPRVVEWLEDAQPDVVGLQELKCMDEKFPRFEIEALGYNIETHGQKTYNGVAILSKHPIEDVRRGLPGNEGDEQSRYIECFTGGVRFGCLYLPNGNPTPGDKFDYKLRWMDHLVNHAKSLLKQEEILVLSGDYNICPKDEDVYDPKGWTTDALCRPESRKRYRQLLNLGLTDALRQMKPSGTDYTFWDYQAGAWQKDNGLRIDHHLLSPQAADVLKDCYVDRKPRGQEKASDHTPIILELDL